MPTLHENTLKYNNLLFGMPNSLQIRFWKHLLPQQACQRITQVRRRFGLISIYIYIYFGLIWFYSCIEQSYIKLNKVQFVYEHIQSMNSFTQLVVLRLLYRTLSCSHCLNRMLNCMTYTDVREILANGKRWFDVPKLSDLLKSYALAQSTLLNTLLTAICQ